MKVIILAGGEGTRLRPYTAIFPKPLLPINETPLLDIVLEKLKNQNIKEIFLAVNYKSSLFKMFYGDGSKKGLNITYLEESKPLGTAGPLQSLENKIDEDFLVMNGDIICDLDFHKLLDFHKKNCGVITVVTREIKTPINFGVIKTKEGRITNLEEKPEIKSEISAGIYIINPGALRHIPKNQFYDMPDLIKKLISEKANVLRFLYDGELKDIGDLKSYEEIQINYRSNKSE